MAPLGQSHDDETTCPGGSAHIAYPLQFKHQNILIALVIISHWLIQLSHYYICIFSHEQWRVHVHACSHVVHVHACSHVVHVHACSHVVHVHACSHVVHVHACSHVVHVHACSHVVHPHACSHVVHVHACSHVVHAHACSHVYMEVEEWKVPLLGNLIQWPQECAGAT